MQYIYVREMLDFVDKQDKADCEHRGIAEDQRSPESLLNLINGQFFSIFRCLNDSQTNLSCPKEKSRCLTASVSQRI